MELGLVIVLRALWLAAILPILIASIPSSKFDWFHTFLLRFARRGKIMQSSSHKLSVPQKFFCHFYVLASLWTALLLIAMWVYAWFVNPLSNLRWYTWIGAAIFFWGVIHQHTCHVILGMLRKNKQQSVDYIIPRGDWFQYVSSPHYLAEIVIYFGLVVALGCSDLTVWLLFGFVVANLVFAAAETHRWYLHKFDNYPKDRFAILPFVY